MRQLERDLWQSTLHQSGILNTHAYFLERPEGNVLFYNTGHDQDLETIAKLGGIRYQLLSHRDESGPSLERIRSRFGSKLGCSSLEAPVVGMDAPAEVIFEEGDRSLEDIEIIHTPAIPTAASASSTARRRASHTSSPATLSFSGTGGGRPWSFATRAEATKRSARACSGCETSNPMSSCGAALLATCRSPRSRARNGRRPSTRRPGNLKGAADRAERPCRLEIGLRRYSPGEASRRPRFVLYDPSRARQAQGEP